MPEENQCGFCEYYKPFWSDLFDYNCYWGDCEIECWKNDEWIEGKIENKIETDIACDRFLKNEFRDSLPSR